MTVKHRLGSYEIVFGPLETCTLWTEGPSFVVTDANVGPIYQPRLPAEWPSFIVPAGEASKSMRWFESIHRWLVQQGAGRDATLVALGGGVVGDLAGFVAATYMRGIRLVQAPTTLLSQVDSAVGGKVGIDLPEGKNIVGAFYPPAAVVVDVSTLETLDPRHRANGMAEVVKYAAIADSDWMYALADARVDVAGECESMIRRCLDVKRTIVEADEMERTGERAALNFGHTVGHALEAHLGYQELLHGEAIAIGMVAESKIGVYLGEVDPEVPLILETALRMQGLPTGHPALDDAEALLNLMRHDKKASRGRIAMSLVPKFGGCKLFPDVPETAIRTVLHG